MFTDLAGYIVRENKMIVTGKKESYFWNHSSLHYEWKMKMNESIKADFPKKCFQQSAVLIQ